MRTAGRVVAVAALVAAAGVSGVSVAHASSVRAATTGVAVVQPGAPSRATQIATLEAAEQKISAIIAQRGVHAADFGIGIPFGDLRSFGIESLWNEGIDGAGTTIAVIEGWSDPSIVPTLREIDRPIGLPNPKVTTIYPAGPLPATCPAGMERLGSYGSCQSWERELTLDVEAAHLIAPYANIVISVTPADTQIEDDASSQVAPPEMMEAVEDIARSHLANVISISDGSNEGDYLHGTPEIHAQDPGELTAAADGVPVVDATGDCGAAQELATGNGFCNDLTPGRAIATWDDSPFVLAVGGNTPAYAYGGANGQDSFTVWNVGEAAEGAGVSIVYRIPAYQHDEASAIGTPWRSVPDITMDAAYGTSLAAPEFAGVLALATQLRGKDLGPINQVLYEDLGPKGAADGIVDITEGNDSAFGVTGYAAGPGFDVATGWGTVDADTFVPALVHAVNAVPKAKSLGQLAGTELAALERTEVVEPSHVAATGALHVTSSGFLPEHPVVVRIDGRRVRVVDASAKADVHVVVDLGSLHLRPGAHVLELVGMLLTQRTTFDVKG